MKSQHAVTVLVLDDDPDHREILALEFEMSGCKVEMAEDFNDALAILKSKSIDIFLCDYLLPGHEDEATGEELPKILKKASIAENKLPLTILMFELSEKLPRSNKINGIAALLPKPIDRTELMKMIFERLGIAA